MYILKRLLAASISLLILLLNGAQAEVNFLVHSNGWMLDNTPVQMHLKADVGTHMPYDADRLTMLTPITDLLSLKIVTGEDSGSVSIAISGNEALSLQYLDNAVQISSMPDFTYTADGDPLSVLLGTDVSREGGYEALGLAPEGESLLADGRELLGYFPDIFEENGKKTSASTSIVGIGQSKYRIDYTFTKEEADTLKENLLSSCSEGWLHEIISGILFSGEQKIRMYFSSDDALMRVEYNGSCGPEDDLRTVKLIYKCRHDDEGCKDYIELTSPAKTGKNKNVLSFERTIQTNKNGVRVMEGNFKYTVVEAGVTSIWTGEFNLSNVFTDAFDLINGTVTLQKKLNDAEKYDVITLTPNLMIAGTQDAPEITGTLGITEKYAGKVTEQAVVSIELKRADPLVWTERARTVDLAVLDEQDLAATQKEVAASIAAALVQPLILTMGKDAQWFFRDLPEDAIQSIIDAALTAVQ